MKKSVVGSSLDTEEVAQANSIDSLQNALVASSTKRKSSSSAVLLQMQNENAKMRFELEKLKDEVKERDAKEAEARSRELKVLCCLIPFVFLCLFCYRERKRPKHNAKYMMKKIVQLSKFQKIQWKQNCQQEDKKIQ